MATKKTRQNCAVKNCSNHYSNITFHRFPKDKERAIIWAKSAIRNDLIPRAETLYYTHRICAAHFEKKYFFNDAKNRLLPSAIPTIFALNNNNLTQENRKRSIGVCNTLALNPKELYNVGNINNRNNVDQSTQTYFSLNLQSTESQTESEEIICHTTKVKNKCTTKGVQTTSALICHHKKVEELKRKNKQLQNCNYYLQHKIKTVIKESTQELLLDKWLKQCETFLPLECASFVQNQALLYKKKRF